MRRLHQRHFRNIQKLLTDIVRAAPEDKKNSLIKLSQEAISIVDPKSGKIMSVALADLIRKYDKLDELTVKDLLIEDLKKEDKEKLIGEIKTILDRFNKKLIKKKDDTSLISLIKEKGFEFILKPLAKALDELVNIYRTAKKGKDRNEKLSKWLA